MIKTVFILKYYDGIICKMRMLPVMCFILNTFIAYSQNPDYSGKYNITDGPGSKLEIIQSSNSISIIYIEDTYTCSIEGNTISGKADRKNVWFDTNAACFDKIMTDTTLAENFKKSITITFSDRKIEGSVTIPSFTCSDDSVPEVNEGRTSELKLAKEPNDLYWITKTKIMKCHVGDSNSKEEFLGGLTEGSDIALDEGGQTVFFVDGASIYAINADGTNKIKMSTAEEPVFSPTGLVVDSFDKVLFWAEGYSLYRYDYTSGNTNRHKMHTQQEPIVWLSLDRKNKRIYWVSNYTDIIYQSNYDGTGVEPFTEDKATNIRIDEEEGVMYAMYYKGVKKINLVTKNKEDVILDSEVHDPYQLFWDKDFKRLYYFDSNQIYKANNRNFTVVDSKLGYFNNVLGLALVTGKASGDTLDPDMAFSIWTLIRNEQ